MGDYLLVIDQSTLSSRAFVFDAEQNVLGQARMDVTQHYPSADRVEQVPEEIWATCLWASKMALRNAGVAAGDLAAIGISNQRATSILWETATGRTLGNAIVWRDQRTAESCAELNAAGHGLLVTERTGLVLHPYFSASKIGAMLDEIPDGHQRAARGEIRFGTVDSYLIHRLTGGRVHATDATNASQTALFDIVANRWDDELLEIFGVPPAMLPEVRDSAADYGMTDPAVLGAAVPILGVVGNQQSALIGQACLEPGLLKATYDEHCFIMLNTGDDVVRSRRRMLTTIAYRIDGKPTYALEGAIVAVGGSLQWLSEDLEMFDWTEIERLAQSADPDKPIYLVPAFIGGGSDWEEEDARGALFGISRGTKRQDLVRAALESVGYQSHDLIETMRRDWGRDIEVTIRVDGGMITSDWTMQFIADITGALVDRSPIIDVTPLGAAWLAGWKSGLWPDAAGFSARRVTHRQYAPRMAAERRAQKLAGWQDARRRVLPERAGSPTK